MVILKKEMVTEEILKKKTQSERPKSDRYEILNVGILVKYTDKILQIVK